MTQPFYSSLDFVRDNPGEVVPEGIYRHLLDFLVQNKHNTCRHTNNLDGLPATSRLIGAPIAAISTFFMLDALPGTTLPIYLGLGYAPTMLACTTGGLVVNTNKNND